MSEILVRQYPEICAANANLKFRNIEINKPSNPLKVIILGELYSLIDNNTTYNSERKLIKMGRKVVLVQECKLVKNGQRKLENSFRRSEYAGH